MKNILKLFTVGLMLSTNAFAATGTGEVQAELSNPLTVTNSQDVNFGTIAIDPGAGAKTVFINLAQVVCPATYVCTGATSYGIIGITGAPNSSVTVGVSSTAVLDDGSGNTLIFDPIMSVANPVPLGGTGSGGAIITGSIDFTGNETAGTYTSANGSGYQMTVNY